MKTKLALLALLVAGVIFSPSRVLADCTSQYGGTTCTSTSLTINKQVQNPSTNAFVENLGSSDPTFSAGQSILFKLIIKNTGSQQFGTVTVKDVLPDELTFVGGPGTFDANSNTLIFTESNVNSGESRTEQVLAKVNGDKLNKKLSMECVVNTGIVSASNTDSSQDTAQFCITNSVLGATTLPVAGFETYRFLLPFTALGLFGAFLVLKKV